jgi:hypothetical protein
VDLDFDGTNLWMSSGTGAAFKLSASTGGSLGQFPVIASTGRDNGNAFRTGGLFVGGLFGGMEVYDPGSGADLGTVVHEDGTPLARTETGPAVFVGAQLVVMSSLGISYYDVKGP